MTQYLFFYAPLPDMPSDEEAAHQELAQHGTWSGPWWEPTQDDDTAKFHILNAGYLIKRTRAETHPPAKGKEQRSHIMQPGYWAHIDQVAEEVGAVTKHGARASAAGHPVASWRTMIKEIGQGQLTVVRADRRGELCERVARWLAGIKLPPKPARQRKAIVRALRALDPDELPPGLRAGNDQEG